MQVQGAAQGAGRSVQPGPITNRPSATDATPEQVYLGWRAAREELADQLERLEEVRESLTEQLMRGPAEASRRGLEQRLGEVDQRILATEAQLAEVDMLVAQAAAVPGAVPPPAPDVVYTPPPPSFGNPPEEYIFLSGMFLVLVLFPIAIAYARRLWKRSAQVVTSLPSSLMERFTRLEQSVESVAIEVERIGEGQRFMTRVFARHAAPGEQVPASLTDELELPDTGNSRR